MNIVLLNAPWINTSTEYGVKAGTRWASVRKRDRTMPFFPYPFSIAYGATVLKRAGFTVGIKDAVAEDWTADQCLAWVKEQRPELAVLETSTPSIATDLAMARRIKDATGSRVVLGGPHATAVPEECLANDYVDFVLIGEYEHTLLELANRLKDRRDLSGLKGLAHKASGAVVNQGHSDPITNLDDLPFPERDALPIYRYTEPSAKFYPSVTMIASRGCSFRCVFCIEPFVFRDRAGFNYRSVGNVIAEIKEIQSKYSFREIFFDDTFFTDGRARQIAQGLLDNNIRTHWSCWIDRHVGPETLRLMKRSGCTGLKFGVETSDPKIQKTIRKNVNFDHVRQLVGDCRKLGLFTHGSFMFGLPGENRETIRKTIDFAFSLRMTSCQFSVATPLPGTDFFAMAETNNWLLTKDWARYEGGATPVIAYADCTEKDLQDAILYVRKRKMLALLTQPGALASYLAKLYRFTGFWGFWKDLAGKALFLLSALFGKKRG